MNEMEEIFCFDSELSPPILVGRLSKVSQKPTVIANPVSIYISMVIRRHIWSRLRHQPRDLGHLCSTRPAKLLYYPPREMYLQQHLNEGLAVGRRLFE